jgi:hypothetical protein
LMASEIALAETSSGGATSEPVTGVDTPQGAQERLELDTSLSFSRDTLEAALATLSEEIGVPIEIRGNDLQTEGITKNQSFAIDLSDRPAREILVEILRLANPDKTATTANDPRQKLVYTIGRDESGQQVIYISTRRATEQRGEQLPAEFLEPR